MAHEHEPYAEDFLYTMIAIHFPGGNITNFFSNMLQAPSLTYLNITGPNRQVNVRGIMVNM